MKKLTKYFECELCREYGYICKARVKKTNEIIFICEECDAVYTDFPNSYDGPDYEDYMKERGIEEPYDWRHLEILERGVQYKIND